MPDLTTMNAATPAGTDPASQGDDQIRTMKSELLGYADLEHARTGAHKFLYGTTASRPAANVLHNGRIYFNIDTKTIQIDVGGVWTDIDFFTTGRFKLGQYTGNGGASQFITSVGFIPELVVTFPQDVLLGTHAGYIKYYPIHGINNSWRIDNATVVNNGIFQQLVNGFTVGIGANTNLIIYGYLALKLTYP